MGLENNWAVLTSDSRKNIAQPVRTVDWNKRSGFIGEFLGQPLTYKANISMTIPHYLYKGFTKKKYAIDFLKKGKFRLGLLQCYKTIEDDNRRDESEGKSESIVEQYLPDFILYLKGIHINPLYLFCTSGPDVDLEYMKAKWPFVVKISDPKKLKNSLNENKPLNTKMKIVNKCKIEEVRYTKGEAVEIDPESIEAVKLSYAQKPRSYEKECEFRYIVNALPPLNHKHDIFYLDYKLGYEIDYASFV
jgi:hypothetical protein